MIQINKFGIGTVIPYCKAAYLDCEAKAAGDWRAAVNALRKWAHTNDEAITAESAAKAATSNRLRELLRYASLHRKGLNEPLDAHSLTLAFELARRFSHLQPTSHLPPHTHEPVLTSCPSPLYRRGASRRTRRRSSRPF